MADNNNRPVTVYEAATLKGVGVQTIRNAVKAGKLRMAFEAPIGKSRTMPMFDPSDIEAWQPGSRGRVSLDAAYENLPKKVRSILRLEDFRLALNGVKVQD